LIGEKLLHNKHSLLGRSDWLFSLHTSTTATVVQRTQLAPGIEAVATLTQDPPTIQYAVENTKSETLAFTISLGSSSNMAFAIRAPALCSGDH
jgi:hypothetical protein